MSQPDLFYKYATSGTALRILEGGRLRWSSPLLFNDLSEFQRMPVFEPTIAASHTRAVKAVVSAVFDGVEEIDFSRANTAFKTLRLLAVALRDANVSRSEIVERLDGELPRSDEWISSELHKVFEESFFSSARVLCVTTKFDNEAMWANYAEGHAGCVLGFRHLHELSTPLLSAKQVMYTAIPPVVGSGFDFLVYGPPEDLPSKTLEAVCFTKKTSWSYEEEWRAVTWRPEEVDRTFGDYKFYPDELESATLGPRTSVETEARVRELLNTRYSRCSLFRLSINRGTCSRIQV